MWKAERGRHGQGSLRHGRNGADLTIDVPPGTVVIDAHQGYVIKDLAQTGDQVTAARGGKGGRGNAHFKSSTNRAPRQCTPGEAGESRRLMLELKMIADVGLVGRPNAGKSTLLSRLSHARPEIADYAFTTKTPHLGRVDINQDESFVLADIPGLIEGAHHGAGLGHDFLRHIERTRVLVHLVEPMPIDQTDPVENYRLIRDELVQYNGDLAERPEIVVVTKAELPGAAEVHARLQAQREQPVLLISAVTGQNVNHLIVAIKQQLDNLASR
jgi:GTP-binding protein